METNIFKNFNFNEEKIKSAHDYLNELESGFIAKTKGELKLEIEAYAILKTSFQNGAGYSMFIIAPKIGNYRKRILDIEESYETHRYPVIVTNCLSEEKFENVSEVQLMSVIEKIILHPLVKNSIESLYKTSKEHNK